MKSSGWIYTGLTIPTTLLAYGWWLKHGSSDLGVTQVDTFWAATAIGFIAFAACRISWRWLHPASWVSYLLCGALSALLILMGLAIAGGSTYIPADLSGIIRGIAEIFMEYVICLQTAGIPILGLCLTTAIATRLFVSMSVKQKTE